MSSRVARERRAQHRRDADRVLIDMRLDILGADHVLIGLQRNDPRLDIEVATELLPHHMHVAAEHQIRPARVLARRLATLTPLPLQRQRPEHDRLRGALRARTRRLPRRMKQARQHPDAALLDLRRLRILRVIDEIAMQILGDDPLRLGLHPRRHKRRQIAHRDPVQHQLLTDQPHRVNRAHTVLRQLVIRRRLKQKAIAIGRRERLQALNQRPIAAVRTAPGLDGWCCWVGMARPPRARIAGRTPSTRIAPSTLCLTPDAGIPRKG